MGARIVLTDMRYTPNQRRYSRMLARPVRAEIVSCNACKQVCWRVANLALIGPHKRICLEASTRHLQINARIFPLQACPRIASNCKVYPLSAERFSNCDQNKLVMAWFYKMRLVKGGQLSHKTMFVQIRTPGIIYQHRPRRPRSRFHVAHTRISLH